MEGDTQNDDGDFRGLTFSRIEEEGLGELSSSAGPGWRSFLVFDPKNHRLARLNAVDLDRNTKQRETEMKFGAKRVHRAFETVYESGQDDDSLFFISSLRLESEPLVTYLEREAPLKPAHGFQLIVDYLEALRDSGGFELAPEGLGFFVAERLRVSTEADGTVRLVFCGFGAADDQDSRLPLQERIAALASRMGLGFSIEDLPTKGGLGEFLKWMESFRDDLPKEEKSISKPESEIRKWLGESDDRRETICKAAPKGMADLVPHLKAEDDGRTVAGGVQAEKKQAQQKMEAAKAENVRVAKELEKKQKQKVEEAKKAVAEAKKSKKAPAPRPETVESKVTPKMEEKAEVKKPAVPAEKEGSQNAIPPVVDEVTLLQRFQDRMRSGNEGNDDDVKDLLPGYQASRQRRSSPLALAFFFCTVAAILIWVVSLNLDYVADSVSKMLGKSREPRSGFQEYQPKPVGSPEKPIVDETAPVVE